MSRESRKLPDGVRGLTIQVYRPADAPDCTLGGISSRFSRLTLVGIVDDRDTFLQIGTYAPAPVRALPSNCQVCEPAADRPPVVLRIRKMGDRLLYTIEPYQADGGSRWYMAGGNYAGSSDSRFSQLAGGTYGALNIHDRHEG